MLHKLPIKPKCFNKVILCEFQIFNRCIKNGKICIYRLPINTIEKPPRTKYLVKGLNLFLTKDYIQKI